MKLLTAIFEKANKIFLEKENDLILSGVSERTLCGSLQKFLQNELEKTSYSNYFVDIEYNRNQGKVKTIINNEMKVTTITCDLIIHSRGTIKSQDNLLALEMKKSNRPTQEKCSDKYRLIALTKSSYDDIWSNDGVALPEHVCGYELGVYYEINLRKNAIQIEYYANGSLQSSFNLKIHKSQQ